MSDWMAGFLVVFLFLILPIGTLTVLVALAVKKAFADRRKCSDCGATFYRGRSEESQMLCPGCIAAKRRSDGAGGGSCLLAIIFLVSGMGLFGWLLHGLVSPSWIAYPTGAVLFPLCLLSISRRLRRAFAAGATLIARRSQKQDFEDAALAAGREGNVCRSDGLVTWSDDSVWDGDAITRVFEETCKAFAKVAGSGAAHAPSLRAILFERETAFAAYTHSIAPDLGRVAGYYMHWLTQRLVVCAEASERSLLTTRGALAHEFTHHLLRAAVGATPPPWLDEGAATLVARDVANSPVEPAAGLRITKAALAREELLSGGRMLDITRARLARATSAWEDIDEWAFVSNFYMQSGGFVLFLRDAYPVSLVSFVERVSRRGSRHECFCSCFGNSPDEVMRDLVAKIEAADTPSHTTPPEETVDIIKTRFADPIRSRFTPPVKRRIAIRSMGAAGWAWRADVLADILEQPDDDMQPEAQRALENISGELRGGDPAAWRTWLASLPAEVTGAKA